MGWLAAPSAHIETWPWDSVSDVIGLDVLTLVMSLLSVWHALAHCKLPLLVGCLVLGALTEFGAIRCGGTHCHNAGLLNFGYCSSVNSVVYYMPWVYSSVVSATRLVGDSRWALPWVCGALTFGMCGIYEMQGPNMRWWKWPIVPADPSGKGGWLVRFDDGALTGLDHLTGSFWQLEPKEAHIISDHAGDALQERIFDLGLPILRPGLPVMAPFFDMAFGWGVGFTLWLLPTAQWAQGPLGEVACVLLGAGAALLWDLPVRLLRAYGIPHTASVPVLMALAVGIPLLLVPGGLKRHGTRDWPLFLIQLSNAAFFSYNALTAGAAENGTALIPPLLKMLVVAVSLGALAAHGLACGLIGEAAAAKRKQP